jgi:hypothetical protein
MTKIAGSGSNSQSHGSAKPDPHQTVMDPQHWKKDEIGKKDLFSQFCTVPYPSEDLKSGDFRIRIIRNFFSSEA